MVVSLLHLRGWLFPTQTITHNPQSIPYLCIRGYKFVDR